MAPPPAPRVKVGPVVKAPPCLWSRVAPAQAPMVLSAALVETLDLALQAPVAWGLTLPSTEDPQWTVVPTISYLPALTVVQDQCRHQSQDLWVDLSLGQAPRNSMDWAPVGPACPPLPLIVALLVISEVSPHQADPAPRDHHSHSAQAPMDPVDQMAHLTVARLGPMDLTSS